MTITQGALSYVVIWSLCVFLLLPVGVKPPQERGLLESAGAPQRSHFRRKIAGAAIMALFFTWLLQWVLASGLITT